MSVAVTAGDLPKGGFDESGDIVGGTPPGNWLVIGWFTPDYRPLAERFAANLAEHGAPFRLWSKEKLTKGWNWNTHRKPSVVLEAMDAYPGKTVVLMDVDCMVRGDIAPVADFAGDVCININARQTRKGKEWRRPILVAASSRVIAFRPTERARTFALEWKRLCEQTHYAGDETALMWAYLRLPDTAFSYMDRRYSGAEMLVHLGGLPADLVIGHSSAHAKSRPLTLGFKTTLKAMERRFLRSGRTKRSKSAGEMSVVTGAATSQRSR